MGINLTNIKSVLFDNKTFKQTILKNTFWLLSSEVLCKFLMLLLTLLIVRHLGPSEYGVFSFIFAFVALFAVLIDFGLSVLAVREIARDKSKAKKYIGNIVAIKLILGIVTFGLIYFVIQFLGKSVEVKLLVYLTAIHGTIASFTAFFQSVFRAFEKMEYEALSKIIYSISLFCLGGIVLWQNLGIKVLVFTYIIAATISLILTLIIICKKFTKFHLSTDFLLWKTFLKQGILIGSGAFFAGIYISIGITILKTMNISYSDIGLYSAAYKIITIPMFILSAVAASFLPILSKERGNLSRIIMHYHKATLVVAIPSFLVIGIFARSILTTFYGQDFASADKILRILSVLLIFVAIRDPFLYTIIARNKQNVYAATTFFGAVFSASCNFLLIKKFGITGAAITMVLTEVLVFVLVLLYVTKINKTLIHEVHKNDVSA